MERPTQGRIEAFSNLLLFIRHNLKPETLRKLHVRKGDNMRIFGGRAHTSFSAVRALMAEENEKIDWFAGPLDDRADYLTKSYVPFLGEGPNHTLRRREIIGGVARAHAQLADLEDLLAKEKDHERALARFLYRHFAKIELTDADVDAHLDFRENARVLTLLPLWFRKTLLRGKHAKVKTFRTAMLKRMDAAGVSIADSWFDVIWFNSGTLGFYPEKAIETLKERKDLQPVIFAEVDLPAGQRPKTRALIHEMLRIYTKIPSTNYVKNGDQVEIAVIATASVDPEKYPDPYKVDLDRDHSDAIGFSGVSQNRGCPGEKFAPDAMASVVIDKIRKGALA